MQSIKFQLVKSLYVWHCWGDTIRYESSQVQWSFHSPPGSLCDLFFFLWLTLCSLMASGQVEWWLKMILTHFLMCLSSAWRKFSRAQNHHHSHTVFWVQLFCSCSWWRVSQQVRSDVDRMRKDIRSLRNFRVLDKWERTE